MCICECVSTHCSVLIVDEPVCVCVRVSVYVCTHCSVLIVDDPVCVCVRVCVLTVVC